MPPSARSQSGNECDRMPCQGTPIHATRKFRLPIGKNQGLGACRGTEATPRPSGDLLLHENINQSGQAVGYVRLMSAHN